MSKKILFIVGSLRQNSFNKQMAQIAEEMIGDRAEVSYLDYADLPLFNEELEAQGVPAMDRIRKELEAADLVWIFSPVYNWAIPGTVKNLLDWASRSLVPSDHAAASSIHDKFFTVSSLANGESPKAVFKHYRELLPFIRTNVIGEFAGGPINPEAWATGKITLSESLHEKLANQVEEVLQELR
ncbi:NADPH-dependent FMN reductase [Streptococcus dysgalactiae subsp. equisimilis]|uniref:NADPH-dependent FMN reductase n=1 Tax=Streptococcus dysgalactiae TaxID=1334 RepID=UPI003FD718BE